MLGLLYLFKNGASSQAGDKHLERLYRTPIGLPIYYTIEIWLRHMVVPCKETKARWQAGYWLDLALVLGFAIFVLAIVFIAAERLGQPVAEVALFSIVLPFASWSVLVGFVIYLQHTSPDVHWVRNLDDRLPATAATVHASFPRWFNKLFHNVMDHVAHHLDPLIPVYVLDAAEKELMTLMPQSLNVRRFTVRDFLLGIKICKLYDYDEQRWLDFNGKPSAV